MPAAKITDREKLQELEENLKETNEDIQEAVEERRETVQEIKEVKKDIQEETKKSKIKLSPLDKLHSKHNAVCYSKALNKFNYYLVDTEGFRKGEYNDMIKRGVMRFDTLEDLYAVLHKNEKLLFGFKPMQGSILLQRFPKQWARLALGARDLRKKGVI